MLRVYIWLSLALACASVGVDSGTSFADDSTTIRPTSSSSAKSAGTNAPAVANNATCISRTVNYITHTLPQQCLRTDRSSTATDATTTTPSHSATGTTNETPIIVDTPERNATFSGDLATAPASHEKPTDALRTSITVTEITSTTSTTTSTNTITPDTTAEDDSPFDNVSFLSFEEWKAQNLAKAGQSPDDIGHERQRTADRQRPDLSNALDMLGEESEIDIDFSDFTGGSANTPPDTNRESSAKPAASASHTSEDASASSVHLSKDAGKTCKERTNYASFDCAATVLKSNPECKSASSVLVENKDSYMLNTCSANNKFFIIELCNDILIDTVVLANYEFFSSSFRHFRVSVSDRYPVKMDKWKDLGTFEARNAREIQAFLIENPLIWARYLRIEFLTHYGNEYYCPVSLLRVHGKTMMQEFRQQEELARGEVDDEAGVETEVEEVVSAVDTATLSTSSVEQLKGASKSTQSESSLDHAATDAAALVASNTTLDTTMPQDLTDELPSDLQSTANATMDNMVCVASNGSGESKERGTSQSSDLPNDPTVSDRQVVSPALNGSSTTTSTVHVTETITKKAEGTRPSNANISSSPTTPSSDSTQAAASTSNSSDTSGHSTSAVTSSAPDVPKQNVSSVSPTPASRVSSSASTAAQSPPQPSTQESFFKSISKRLSQLESNSTLSLQYIEEQSRILRDAFTKVEKRQISATSNFLNNLNDTVMLELNGFRQAYDQLWQSTVIELEGQQEQYQREMLALSSRLTIVADELLWQKRMGIMQSTLLLLCLGLMLFARPGTGYLEMPLVQQMMNRSQAALRSSTWDSEPHSPSSPNSRSPVSLLRRKLWRASAGTNGYDTRSRTSDGFEVQIEPPTPRSDESPDVFDDPHGDIDRNEDGTESLHTSPESPFEESQGGGRPPDWSPSAAQFDRPRSPIGVAL